MTAKHLDEAAVTGKLSALPERGLRYGERYVIVREGRDMAALVSVADLWRLEQDYPGPVPSDAIMELAGALDGLPDDVGEEFLATVRAARTGADARAAAP